MFYYLKPYLFYIIDFIKIYKYNLPHFLDRYFFKGKKYSMYYYEDLILISDYNLPSDTIYNVKKKSKKNLDQVFQESDKFGDDYKKYLQLKIILCNALSYHIKTNIKSSDILIDEHKYHELIDSVINIDTRSLFAFKKIKSGKYNLKDWFILDSNILNSTEEYIGFKNQYNSASFVCLWPPCFFESKNDYANYSRAKPGSFLFSLWMKAFGASGSSDPKSLEEASEKFPPNLGLGGL